MLRILGAHHNVLAHSVPAGPFSEGTDWILSLYSDAGQELTHGYSVGMTMSQDGKKLLMMGANTLVSYTLTTPWVLSSASQTGSTQISPSDSILGLTCTREGDAVIVINTATDKLELYTLPTSWNATGAVFADDLQRTDLATGDPIYEVYLADDRTTLYVWSASATTSLTKYTLAGDLGLSGASAVPGQSTYVTGTPEGLCASSDEKRFWSLDSHTLTIREYVTDTSGDLGAIELVDIAKLPSGISDPSALSISYDQGVAFVADIGTGSVHTYYFQSAAVPEERYDGTTLPAGAIEQVGSVSMGATNGMCIHDNTLYIGNASGSIGRASLTTEGISTVRSSGNYNRGLASDGTTIYVGMDDNRIYTMDPDGSNYAELVNLGTRPAGMCFFEGFLWVVNEGDRLYKVDPSDGTFTYETMNATGTTGVYMTPTTVVTNSWNGEFYALSRSNLTGPKLWTHSGFPSIFDDFAIHEPTQTIYALDKGGTIRKQAIFAEM